VQLLLSRTTIVCVVSVLIALGLGLFPFVKHLEQITLDKRFQWRWGYERGGRVFPNLVFIGIGDREIQKYGKWPWAREIQIQMLAAFTNNTPSPRVIAYDVLFNVPTSSDDVSRESDVRFGAMLKQMGNVCLPGMLKVTSAAKSFDSTSTENDNAWLQQQAITQPGDTASAAGAEQVALPLPQFREETCLGLFNTDKDYGGVRRKIPILIKVGPHWIPSLALRTAMRFHEVQLNEVTIKPGHEVILQRGDGWRMRIPIDSKQQMRINFRGKLTDFQPVTFQGVVDWVNPELRKQTDVTEIGKVLDASNEGVVLIGWTATGQEMDTGPTPLEDSTPLVAVQINAINALLNGDFIRETPWWLVAIVTVLLSILGSWITQRFSAIGAAALTIGLLLSFVVLTLILFFFASFWIPWVVPMVGLILPSSAGLIMRLTGTEETVEAFQTYVLSNLTREKLRRATSSAAEPSGMSDELLRKVGVEDHGSLIGMGKFNLLCKLGQGGMGAVFLGRQKNLKRFCAIKVLNAALAEDKEAISRFLREAQSMANLQHPNLVGLFDCDQYESQYYIAMEFVEGLSLGDILRKAGALPLPIALHFLKQAAQGMAYYHERGIVHRDIKPDNMMIDASGTLKITDLGLAKNILEQDQGMTVTGTVMGSPYYMSPEQINDSKNVDARADLYSLGIAFYQMITGKVPFSGSSPGEVCMAHLQQPMPSVSMTDPSMTQALDALVGRITAKDRDARVQSAAQLLADIEPWAQSNPVDEASQQIFGQLDFAGRTVAFLLQKHGVKQELIDADLSSLGPRDDSSKEASKMSATQVERAQGGTRATIPQIEGDQTVMRGTSVGGGTNVGGGTSVGSGTEQTIIRGTSAPQAPTPAAASPATPAPGLPPSPISKPGRFKWIVIGGVVVLVIIGAVVYFLMRGKTEEPLPEPVPAKAPVAKPDQTPSPKPATNVPPAVVTNTAPAATTNAAPVEPAAPAPAPAAPEPPPATPAPAAPAPTPPAEAPAAAPGAAPAPAATPAPAPAPAAPAAPATPAPATP
jgi:serine/threonine-protein kinase